MRALPGWQLPAWNGRLKVSGRLERRHGGLQRGGNTPYRFGSVDDRGVVAGKQHASRLHANVET
jgi:hypothetical protein